MKIKKRCLHLFFWLMLFGLTLMLSDCVSYYHIPPGTLEASKAQISLQERGATWQRAIGVLLDQGYVPQVLNETAFFISARRRDDLENDALVNTMVTVYISQEGTLRVEISGGGLFTSEKQFLNAISEKQNIIFNLIMNRSGGASGSH